MSSVVSGFSRTRGARATEDLVPTPPEHRAEKRLLRRPLALPAAIQLIPTLVPRTGTVLAESHHPGVNQDRRGRRPAEAFYPLTLITRVRGVAARGPRSLWKNR
ncbi:MAG: hypothetical protein AUF76_10570 [Acidobacteria bacterium 13_1_20CM_2_65_9]|nr:MAG: hypothetical protein AUF76_10570 [Acidobacteria bacterium 13_1_20CM_2_65_9]